MPFNEWKMARKFAPISVIPTVDQLSGVTYFIEADRATTAM